MKILKIGQINFPEKYGKITFISIINDLNKVSKTIKYEYEDCLTNECDIVFYSLYGKIKELENIKGTPKLIYWTYEHMCQGMDFVKTNPFEFYKRNNLSISFYDDSDDNLFFPYFVLYLVNMIDIQGKNIKLFDNRNKFCTFCAGNESIYNANFRTNFVKYVSSNYKEITCCGKVLNNTNGEYLSYDYYTASVYHNNYRFNLCFENAESSNNLTYLTEKIVMAYTYNVVPIYWGAKRVIEWFNPESFINCNDLTYEQMLNKIKEIDNNEELYQHMLHQNPMYDNPYNIYLQFIEKLDNFIIKHI